MKEFMTANLIFILSAAPILFFILIRGIKWTALLKNSVVAKAETGSLQTNGVACHVKLIKDKESNCSSDIFCMTIHGSIHCSGQTDDVIVKIYVDDISKGPGKAEPVYSCIEEQREKGSRIFCYSEQLSKLPFSFSTSSDWVSVVRIPVDWLEFPYKGKRKLNFRTSIITVLNEEQLASASCSFNYENILPGYMDSNEDMLRTKIMSARLALAVAGATGRISDSEAEIIEEWVRENSDTSETFYNAGGKLAKASAWAIGLFPGLNRIYIHKLCQNISKLAPPAIRHNILYLCLHVVGANAFASSKQLSLVKDAAGWLGVNMKQLRSMIEKTAPACLHNIRDIELSIGITSNMNKDQGYRQLSNEYRKWNTRVTNSNPAIQEQAETMLKLIAETREQFTGE